MYFKPSTNVEVFNQNNQLNTFKGCDYHGSNSAKSAKCIKIATKALPPILANLFNVCFKLGALFQA